MTKNAETYGIWATSLLTMLGVIFGFGVAWAQLDDVRKKQDAYTENLQRIDQRLSRIEGHLGVAP